jgi:hypothetical protein
VRSLLSGAANAPGFFGPWSRSQCTSRVRCPCPESWSRHGAQTRNHHPAEESARPAAARPNGPPRRRMPAIAASRPKRPGGTGPWPWSPASRHRAGWPGRGGARASIGFAGAYAGGGISRVCPSALGPQAKVFCRPRALRPVLCSRGDTQARAQCLRVALAGGALSACLASPQRTRRAASRLLLKPQQRRAASFTETSAEAGSQLY